MGYSDNFEKQKTDIVNENERKYGHEIRKKYGSKAVERSNEKLKNMTKEQFNRLDILTNKVNDAINAAINDGDPAGEKAQKACELHEEWIKNYWSEYSREAHMSLVQMYVDDKRFTAYYDKIAEGSALFLRDAMRIYTGIKD